VEKVFFREKMVQLKMEIHSKFPIKDQGPIYFWLNMYFIRNREQRTIVIHQQAKIEKLVSDMKLDGKKQSRVPADPHHKLSKDQCPKTSDERNLMANIPYKSIVGRLLYLCITARPDITPAVSQVAKFCEDPGVAHWDAVKRIVLYLHGTRNYRLQLGGMDPNFEVSSFADADWAGDLDNRKSRTGFVIYLNGSAIMWSSKLQKSTALSSTEAEYLALSSTTTSILWLRNFVKEMGFNQEKPSVIFQDNKSCIEIASSFKQHAGIKRIDLRDYFVREHVLVHKSIELKKKATGDMVADLMTKQLPYPAFSKHRVALSMKPS
jgi:hypothetical protein